MELELYSNTVFVRAPNGTRHILYEALSHESATKALEYLQGNMTQRDMQHVWDRLEDASTATKRWRADVNRELYS